MFDKITSLFQSGSAVPDLIAVLNLEEWYLDLSDKERQKVHQYSTAFGTGGEVNLLEQSVSDTSQTAQEYLKGVGSTAASENDYEFAEQVLQTALKFEDGSATSTHFTYTELIDVYYKQRDEWDDAIEKCIKYCKKDIEIADEFVAEFGDVPRIPSFKRLAIIYEKQDQYEEALNVCDQALEIGTTDGTKGGFEGRKERIRKKMD
ncbi:tetratricopeptide repeat protein [Halosolutus amylolyticus]|uniref:Tetratricopeptide repeat protein n=1 Tax=Halosolutus amylolyticus TaxID=2932267 RepID=A0ABD5PK72_9EURY|nr:tetratricopeptide repeat protein [Halosolutus amylolyticus]